jgi:hypothetical protein
MVFLFLRAGMADAQASDPAKRSDLKAALDALTPTLAPCDALLSADERKATGTLVLAFTITPTGSVTSLRIAEKGKGPTNVSTLASESLRRCVLNMARLWVFPRARAEKGRPSRVNVEMPVRFPVGKPDGR